MTLKDDLTDIHGIGEAKADEILAIVDDHNERVTPVDIDGVDAAIEQARRGNEGEVIAFLESLR